MLSLQKRWNIKPIRLKTARLALINALAYCFSILRLRTRLSTQIAARNLGMEAIVFNVDKEGWALEFEEGAIMSGSTVEHVKGCRAGAGQLTSIFYASEPFRP